jgi:hypothetical protein
MFGLNNYGLNIKFLHIPYTHFKKTVHLLYNQNLKIMLPKFLLADNSLQAPESIYVVHNENPRFIIESDIDDFWSNQKIHWIDDEPENEEMVAQLIEEAEEFLEMEFEQEFDEDEDEDE